MVGIEGLPTETLATGARDRPTALTLFGATSAFSSSAAVTGSCDIEAGAGVEETDAEVIKTGTLDAEGTVDRDDTLTIEERAVASELDLFEIV
jgi:hypothetical protein